MNIVHTWYAICEGSGAVYTMVDLTAWSSGMTKRWGGTTTSGHTRVTHQCHGVADEQLSAIRLQQLRKSVVLRGDISHYARTPADQSYALLIGCARREIMRAHQEANRLAGERARLPHSGQAHGCCGCGI